ncbi:MAG TPA: gluconate 2-dehydrogenase subunit 3 family protein [Terriglobia bacterium]|nr:gluconate 2-dehydrogenase subunit 3 family protein [Terriglobia bacterium]
MSEPDKPIDLTRRQWLLRLGGATVLAGCSGAAGEELVLLGAPPRTDSAAPALPPGLYAPSPEHMAHVLFRDQRYVDPPAGSATEYARPPQRPFKPAFFSMHEFPLVKCLVGLLLNAPDDAAAKNGMKPVKVETVDEIAEWIDLVVSEAAAVRQAVRKLSPQHLALAVDYYGEEAIHQLESGDPQATWRDGLAWLGEMSGKLAAGGFLDLTLAQQVELLASISETSSPRKAESAGTRFYRLLKNQTIEGYYTSQAGLKELDYKGNAFYAASPGCPQT